MGNYIGKEPVNGFFTRQSLTTDGSTVTFTLNFTIASTTSILVLAGGVVQEPDVAYTLSGGGTAITFTTAPASNTDTYIHYLGQAVIQTLQDFNGTELILDVDADTTIHADTDDEIDFKIGGSDVITFKATGIHLPDGEKYVGGTGDDLQLYHDGTNSYLANSTGELRLATLTSGIAIAIGHSTSEVTFGDNVTVTGNLTIGGTTNFGDFNITNVGSIALDTITNDGTDITLDSSGDIILDAAGNDIFFKAGGTTIGEITNSSSDLVIKSSVSDKDILIKGNDGGSAVTALTLDMSDAGAATFNDKITVGDGKLVLNSTAITSTAAELNLLDGVSGLVQADLTKLAALDATAAELNIVDGDTSASSVTIVDADQIILNDNGTMKQVAVSALNSYTSSSLAADDLSAGNSAVLLTTTSGDITIDAAANDSDIIIKGTDGGADTTFLTIDGSAAGAATFNSTITTTGLVIGSTAVTSTAAELNLIDGGTSRGTDAVASGDGILINDAGTMKMTNVDTVSTYFSSHTVGGGNIVTTGALGSGSIAAGFGNIDNGASNITSGGLVKLDVDVDADDVSADSATGRLTIGASEDLNLYHGGTHSYIVNDTGNLVIDTAGDLTFDAAGNDFKFLANGTEILNITNSSSDVIIKPLVDAKDIIFQQRDGTEVARVEDNATFNVVAGKLALGGTAITASAADINLIDGITNGTVIASKALIADSNIDITGGRNITISGELDAATGDFSGVVDIAGQLTVADGSAGAPSISNTGDANTGLLFSAADTLAFSAGGTSQFTMADGAISPVTNNDIDLGTASLQFKNVYVDGTTFTDAIGFGTTVITLPTGDGNADQVLTTDGSGALSFVDNTGGTAWVAIKTGAYTAAAGEGVFVNTTSSAFAITLPSSPSLGDEVSIVDYAGTFDSNACTIARNSQPIMGVAEDLVVSTERASFTLVYVDGTQGWLFKGD